MASLLSPLTLFTCHHTTQVTGEEEIPEGVVAVLTPDAPDVLSHVSVRARNMRVLFATCHDAKPLDDIKVGLRGCFGLATLGSCPAHAQPVLDFGHSICGLCSCSSASPRGLFAAHAELRISRVHGPNNHRRPRARPCTSLPRPPVL